MKELFMAAHEQLIEERMSRWYDENPDATGAEISAEEALAYDETADAAGERMTDMYADMIDQARQRKKYSSIDRIKDDLP